MNQDNRFGFFSTADDVVRGLSLEGRSVIITGGASGIGTETSRSLALAGAAVTIATRRPDAAEPVAEKIRLESGNARIEVRKLDLADLGSVKRFIDDWRGPLHVLINNAGVMALPTLQRTGHGCEMQFATNFLGHFALTLGLRPYLSAARNARVVSVSSSGNLFAPILWDDAHFRFIPYNPLLAYGQSKTACALLAVAIGEKWGDGITCNALNPGAIATNLQRYTGGLQTPEHLRKSVQQGAATSVFVAASPSLEGISGGYYENCRLAEVRNERPASTPDGVARYAIDAGNADRLWTMASALLEASY